jgi:hypothetical protein
MAMSTQALLQTLLLWGIYPLWLLAGAFDYLCHRQTDIEHSSGSGESWYHVLQFLVLLVAFAAATLLEVNAVVFGLIVLLVLLHSVLAHMDVSYTDGRRYISPLEQHVHGFMEVLPLVAAAILGVLHWDEIGAGFVGPAASLVTPFTSARMLLLISFIVLAGAPIAEELMRTRRHRFERRAARQAGLATIK